MIDKFPRKNKLFRKSKKSKSAKLLPSNSLVTSFLLYQLYFFLFRHRILVKGYENTITNLEIKLAKQAEENEELRQRIDRGVKTECIASIDQSTNLSFETDNISLRSRIDELSSVLREEREKCGHAEEMIKELKTRCDGYEYYSRVRTKLFVYFKIK